MSSSLRTTREYRRINIDHKINVYNDRYSLIKWSVRLGSIAIIEDCLRISLYSILLLTWKNCTTIWIQSWLYPHLFVTIVISTILICHECDWAISSSNNILQKLQRLIISILCQVPVMIITIAFGIFILPFIFMQMLSDDFGLDQSLRKNNKLQSIPILKILHYILSQNNKQRSIQYIKYKIIASNFYILSMMKSDLNYIKDDKNKGKNIHSRYVSYIAHIHNEQFLSSAHFDENDKYQTLNEMKWSKIRKLSINKKDFHLFYGIFIEIICLIYRCYDISLLFIGYLLYFLDDTMWNDHQFKIIMICVIFLLLFIQCLFLIKMIDIYFSYFLLFHILFDLSYIQSIEENDDFDIEILLKNIEIVYEILFDSIQQIKVIKQSNINNDIGNIIIQYLPFSYNLPSNGDITEINRVINDYNICEFDQDS